ncbi:MAG: hypothetical protein HKM95_05045, partial [Inquilinus sp.]|nr:hypothetical protein [Inquilinus sp.]
SIAVADTAIAAAEVPLPSGGSAGLSGSSLVTSAAFGDGPGNAELLDDAIAVISLSDGDHAYRAGLADSVTAVARGFGLDALLAAGEAQSYAMPLGGGLSLSMAVAGDPLAAAHDPWAPEGEPLALQLSGALGAATGLRLGIDVTAADQLAAAAGLADGLFWSADETMRPLGLLTGRGNGLSLDHALGDTTRLSLGLFDGETANGLLADGAAGNGATLGQAGLRHGFASGASFGVDVGLLAESAAMLGSQGAGALSTEAGADTRFLTVGGGVPLGDRLELFGSMTLATSEVGESADSLLTGWDSVQSNALALGAIARDVAADGDRLGLLVGQPLRAYRAEATVTVPVDVTADGAATLQSERVDLTPSGREIDFQLAYDRPLAPGMGLSTWLLFQLQPGHDADADPAYGAGLRFRFGF